MFPSTSNRARPGSRAPVVIELADARLEGYLVIPLAARGLVVFAHGSGSSRHSPRNEHVAAFLQGVPVATLLVDLLTADEERVDERTHALRFDIDRLASRVASITDWLQRTEATAGLSVGYFGASTGAAAALVAAAARKDLVRAVVSRGGRPDLAGDALGRVIAPTLLIVGGADDVVLELNRQASRMMRAPCRLEVVPGATHLFEEPGALDDVEMLAADWFERWLGEPARAH